MKGFVAALLVLSMLGASMAFAGLASAQERDLMPVVETGSTDRLGGGDWITVRAGDARVGVVYGTIDTPNKVYVFAEYKRYLGGVDIYDTEGNYLATRNLPVFTIFGQSMDALIEFEDRSGDGLLNFRALNISGLNDVPVKASHLVTAWSATEPTTEVVGDTTWVNFTVYTEDLGYGLVWDRAIHQIRPGTPDDGAVERIAFTFHLRVNVREFSGEVPWWQVTVEEGPPYIVTTIERLENRTFSGEAVAMGAKYDHIIEGWDFASPDNRLALETRAFVGHYVPDRVARFLHLAYHTNATDGGEFRHREADTFAERPTLLTKDVVYFDDNWDRIGRLVWQSNVTVDGVETTMLFQVQGGEGFLARHGGTVFAGFAIRGAFIYPAGASIFHDPGLEASSFLWSFPGALDLTPLTVLAIQVAIAGIAMGAAALVRARGRRAK